MDVSDTEASQVDIPVHNTTKSTGSQITTIQEILEKVDLFNFAMWSDEDDEKLKEINKSLEAPGMKDNKDVKPKATAAAFLGPKMWKKPITLDMLIEDSNDGIKSDSGVEATGAEFSVMNINAFLNENNIDVGQCVSPSLVEDIFEVDARGQREETPAIVADGYSRIRAKSESESSIRSSISVASDDPMMDSGVEMPQSPSTSFGIKRSHAEISQPSPANKTKNQLPKGGNDFLYVESKRARLEREKEERRLREEAIVAFSADELALATIPGADFDPAHRQFSLEELRPQPIIRKMKRSFVDTTKKDDRYWESRKKNNIAARRSREARRVKENQICVRTAFLEQQNAYLKEQLHSANNKIQKLNLVNKILNEQLKKYQSMNPFLNGSDV